LIDFADKPQIAAVLISPASSETIKSTWFTLAIAIICLSIFICWL
jgi:hypothetical protein